MNSRKMMMFLFVAFYIATCFVYWIIPEYDGKILVQYAFILSSLALGVAGGVYSLHKYGLKGSKSNTLMLLTAGMFCWFVGESIWSYYEYMNMNPFPSVADICYILAYPLFFLALMRELWRAKINWKTLSKSLIFLIILSSILLVGMVLYFGVFLAYQPTDPVLTNTIAISYGIADLILVVAAMMLLILAWEFKGGALSRIWMSLFLSFLLILISDILFAINKSTYAKTGSFNRNLTDSIWILGYLIFAFALFNFGICISSAQKALQKLLATKTPLDVKSV